MMPIPTTEEQNNWKHLAGEAAAELVQDGMIVGLGTGSTSAFLVQALARRIQKGLRIVGAVCSSIATTQLATSLNIPITDLDTYPELDIYIDGADEIDPHLQLIKGAGGALVREKILSSVSRRFIVIADPTKKVPQLGLHFPVPVEIIPLATTPIARRLTALGARVQLREKEGKVFVTDNHNFILDCTFPQGIADPQDLNTHIESIVGVVETGLFLNMAHQVIIGGPDGVQALP